MWLIYKLIFKLIKKQLKYTYKDSIRIILPYKKKSIVLGQNKSRVEININNKYYLIGLLLFGLPYLGLGYSKGYWSTNNLKELLDIGAKNKKKYRSIIILDTFSSWYNYITNFVSNNTILKSKKQISFHYDLGNKFYSLWLDKSMTYSSAIFRNNTKLEHAQHHKYKQIARSAKIKKYHSVLEIGCGWGGFINYVENNIGSKITGITLSNEQYNHVKKNITKNSLVEYKDYRNIKKKYDRIISIEMFEAVGSKNWNIYFQKLKQSLNKNGLVALQVITISEESFNYYQKRKDFIQKYIFPGGMLPTKKELSEINKKVGLDFSEIKSFGLSYAKTLSMWNNQFQNSWQDLVQLGFNQRFKRMWEFYLAYCETGFISKSTDVSHFLINK